MERDSLPPIATHLCRKTQLGGIVGLLSKVIRHQKSAKWLYAVSFDWFADSSGVAISDIYRLLPTYIYVRQAE